YRRMQWRCNALNEKSRAAARRLGYRFEGIWYNHMIVKGRNRDTAWYSILDTEWPRKAGGASVAGTLGTGAACKGREPSKARVNLCALQRQVLIGRRVWKCLDQSETGFVDPWSHRIDKSQLEDRCEDRLFEHKLLHFCQNGLARVAVQF